jgi:hypothetical protein
LLKLKFSETTPKRDSFESNFFVLKHMIHLKIRAGFSLNQCSDWNIDNVMVVSTSGSIKGPVPDDNDFLISVCSGGSFSNGAERNFFSSAVTFILIRAVATITTTGNSGLRNSRQHYFWNGNWLQPRRDLWQEVRAGQIN